MPQSSFPFLVRTYMYKFHLLHLNMGVIARVSTPGKYKLTFKLWPVELLLSSSTITTNYVHLFLGAFAKLRKEKLASSFVSVCLYGTTWFPLNEFS
jgi:hypothetical protein